MLLKGLPRIGLGLAALGRPGYINLDRTAQIAERSEEAMQQRAFEVLDAAYAAGVRYFDCARSYGLSEVFMRNWLAEQQQLVPGDGQIVVGSKWGYRYTANWQVEVPGGGAHEVKDHSLEHLNAQSAETLATLGGGGGSGGNSYLKLLQIHSATLESGVLEDKAVLSRMAELRDAHGWRLGLSLSGVAQGETLRRALETGIFDTVQATYNCMEQSAGQDLLAAKEAGLEVIVKEAMANGRVLRSPPLLAAAERLGCAPDALALAAVVQQPFEPIVLSGAVTPSQAESNCEAMALAESLRGIGEVEALMEALVVAPEAYWQERSELTWN
ncbi:hypothetical protein TrVE_jg1543 [Triparma verrucosa]|uniref:NADP-dependent oxidoreductase domain-containing protein n=1 Tax=Triparma verrucosa TaxID=1606542 RepID=A0A9W7KY34_9STRA|nr:hypothetical protein TrVE_jg1543 [Triparma verrucosa]